MDNNIAAATTIAFGLFRLQKKVRIFFARPSKLPKPTVITCKMAQQQAEVVARVERQCRPAFFYYCLVL